MLELELGGDAELLFTAPAFITLERRRRDLRLLERLRGSGDVEVVEDDWSDLFKGSLTFHDAKPTDVRRLLVRGALCEQVRTVAEQHVGVPVDRAEVAAMVFDDGSISVSVGVHVPEGWGAHRSALLARFGPGARDVFVQHLREVLLAWASALGLVDAAAAGSVRYLPYFNLTYVGRTDQDQPGRTTIDVSDLRSLVYPTTSAPLTSHSPLLQEYFYAGYAFLVLGVPETSTTPRKLRDLLLLLDVVYGQLAAAAEEASLRLEPERAAGAALPGDLEADLRLRYRELITPTFSYDHHVLCLRNALLDAWNVAPLLERSQDLLRWSAERDAQAQRALQASRSKRINLALTALGLLAVFDTAASVVSLIDRFF